MKEVIHPPLHFLLESLQSGILFCDNKHRLLFYNARAKQLPRKYFPFCFRHGENILKNAGKEFKDKFLSIFYRVALGETVTESLEFTDEHWELTCYEVTYFPVTDDDNHFMGMGIAIKDITRQSLAQEDNRIKQEELEQRVDARNRELQYMNRQMDIFSSTVSHDLRAPLRNMKLFAELLEKKYSKALDEKGREFVSFIRQSATDMDRLLQDLLQFSRARKKDFAWKKLNMRKMVDDLCKNFTLLPDCKATFKINGLLPAFGDEAAVREVWRNLLDNAVKFSATIKKPVIEIGCEKGHGDIMYFVKDNGIGFDPSFSQEIFRIFRKLNKPEEFDGTGMGLAIVEQIIQRHGGRVWAKSKPGKGAVFWFTLPQKPLA